MTGSLSQCSLEELTERRSDDQQSLAQFGGGADETYIAVVSRPNDTGILDECDEWMESLGMPDHKLEQFWKKRSAYRRNRSITRPHNRAFDECNLHDSYVSYLNNDSSAKKCVSEILSRVRDGEDIVLVCFEESPKKCHRHILVDYLGRQL